MQFNTETLPAGTRVYTTKAHRFGTDAILLAGFCEVKPGWSVCDLGTGCGILVLALWDAGLRGHATGVELDPAGAALLQAAAQDNSAEVQSVCADIRAYRENFQYDLVVSNPPYFTGGLVSPDNRRAAARHQHNGSIADFCATASRLLKDKGRFAVCYPASQLAELFDAMAINNVPPKRLCLVRKSTQHSPWLALVEGRKAGKPGLSILPDIILPPGTSAHF